MTIKTHEHERVQIGILNDSPIFVQGMVGKPKKLIEVCGHEGCEAGWTLGSDGQPIDLDDYTRADLHELENHGKITIVYTRQALEEAA